MILNFVYCGVVGDKANQFIGNTRCIRVTYFFFMFFFFSLDELNDLIAGTVC